MEGFLAEAETKPLQQSIKSKRASTFETAGTTSYFNLDFRSYTPWSLQARYSVKSKTKHYQLQPPALRIVDRDKSSALAPGLDTSQQTKGKKCLYSNPWRVVSAPSSYTYSHREGSFTNGRGCTWTPYYFRFSRTQYTPSDHSVKQPSQSNLDIKLQRNVLGESNELKPTKSWIWSDQLIQQDASQRKRKRNNCETFVYLMRSPYLNGKEHTGFSSQKRQSSRKCEAWLKSNIF